MDIRAAEISAILKEQIKNFGQEAEVAEIGQVLRHREQKTTAIYAKADVLALSPLARPWPGRAR